ASSRTICARSSPFYRVRHAVSMAKKVSPLAVLATALVGLTVVGGCGAGAQSVKRPFVAGNGTESGPSSGLWGLIRAGWTAHRLHSGTAFRRSHHCSQPLGAHDHAPRWR